MPPTPDVPAADDLDYRPLHPPWRGLLDSSSSLRGSTAALPNVTVLCFTSSVMQLYFHLLPDSSLQDLSAARSTVVIALAMSVVTCAFTLSYSMLEIYYIQMVEAAAKREPGEQRQQRLLEDLDAVLDDFTAMRALSRNGSWAALLMMMLALAAQAAESGFSAVSLVVVLLFAVGVIGVACTVVTFRRTYLPMLAKADFVR